MKKTFNKIHYSTKINPLEKFLKGLLAILSPLYLAGINVRNFLYSKNILKKTGLSAYTISIGNLTTGGTGKTPLTIMLAKYIRDKLHKKTAILSHGYGGKLPTNQVNIISDGQNINFDSHLAGDEPYLIASQLRDIPVLTGKNRSKSGQYAIENFGAEVILLDDGFQHIKLERDLNILVIDLNKKFGNNLLLPAGPLREPIEEIKRADKIILANKKPFDKNTQEYYLEFSQYLEKNFNKPVYLCNIKNGEIYDIKTLEPLITPQKAYAFTGIAQPEFFFGCIKEQNIQLLQTKEFTDHHLYTPDDLKNLINEAQKLEITALITTEKDAVKLIPLLDKIETKIPIFALKLELEMDLHNLIGDL